MDEYSRIPCLPKTRLDVIRAFTDWIADGSIDRKSVLWLHGVAGSGKSTISTTLAQTMRDLDRLGAFFYFNRDIPERNAATLIRTLAHQLAIFDPQIGTEVSRVVERNPNIAAMPLEFQFTNLLAAQAFKSVQWSGGPILLIIDALDECGSKKDRKHLMQVLSKGFSYLPPFIRVVVSSREEPDIKGVLESHPAVHSYHLDINSTNTIGDITEFLRCRFIEIRTTKKNVSFPSNWPSDDVVYALRERAAGLFVWAATACLYIDNYDPLLRLRDIISQESVQRKSAPFANLDRLYKTGLHSAGNWDDPPFRSDCCSILGTVLCARIPMSCSAMDSLLALPRPCVQSISHLRCVLQVGKTEDAVRILHPSFHDYLSSRCQAEVWSIDTQEHNAKLAVRCIDLLDRSLRENICGLTLPHHVQKESIPEAVSYACAFWIEHVCLMSDVGDDIANQIHRFLCRHLLHWIEAQAILKSHGKTIQSLQNLLDRLKVGSLNPMSGHVELMFVCQTSSAQHNDLWELVYDAHRFAQYFANTIVEHPLLVYVTALPFTPANTIIYQKFYRKGLPKVICGVPKSWPPQLLLFQGHEMSVTSVAFSPDGSKIVSGSFDKTIRVWDASTGVETLPPLRGHDGLILSHSRTMDRKLSRGLKTRPFEFGMQAPGSRHSRHCKATIMWLILSHSRMMDRKLSRGLMTRPFEFGMQAPGSRHSRRSKATMALFILSHSRTMDRKLSRGLTTRPFEFGMQAPGSRPSRPSKATMKWFPLSHFRTMDRKWSRGLQTGPFEFGMQAPGSRHSRRFKATMTGFIQSHSHPRDRKFSRGLQTRPFESGMQAPGPRHSRRFKATMTMFVLSHSRMMDRKLSRSLMTRPFECGMQVLGSRHSRRFEATIERFILLHSRPMDRNLSRGLETRPFEFGMQAPGSRHSRRFKATMTMFILSHSRTMDRKLSRGLGTRPFEFGMQAPGSRRSRLSEATMTVFILSQSHTMDRKLSRGLRTRPFEFGMQAPGSRHSRRSKATRTWFILSHSHPMDRKLSRGPETRPFEFGMQAPGSRHSRRCTTNALFIPPHSPVMVRQLSRGLGRGSFEFGMQVLGSRYPRSSKDMAKR